MIEDNSMEIRLKKAIHLMNMSFFVIICFFVWMVYLNFLMREDRKLSGNTFYLCMSFMGLIIAPIFNVLNHAVRSSEMLGEGCKQKLQLLDLKLNLLQKQESKQVNDPFSLNENGPQEDIENPPKYQQFRNAIQETILLIDQYPIPIYRFFYVFDITPDLCNKIVTRLLTIITTFVLGLFYNFTTRIGH